MKIQILQSAESEIADGMDYYNNQYPGLGYEFATEIKMSPKTWETRLKNYNQTGIN